MTKRKLSWTFVAIALPVTALAFVWAFFCSHEITLTQAMLQDKIDAKIPHTASGVTISSVGLDLSKDKIGLALDAEATQFEIKLAMSAATTGTLRYDSDAGSFYFHPESLEVGRVTANDETISEKTSKFMHKLADSAAGKVVDKLVDTKKILDYKPEILGKAKEAAVGMVQKAAEAVLARVPVYTLPDTLKGNAVRVVLEDVEVKNGTIIAHVSLWTLTKMVVFYAVAFIVVLALAVLMLLNPGWGG